MDRRACRIEAAGGIKRVECAGILALFFVDFRESQLGAHQVIVPLKRFSVKARGVVVFLKFRTDGS